MVVCLLNPTLLFFCNYAYYSHPIKLYLNPTCLNLYTLLHWSDDMRKACFLYSHINSDPSSSTPSPFLRPPLFLADCLCIFSHCKQIVQISMSNMHKGWVLLRIEFITTVYPTPNSVCLGYNIMPQ